MEAEGRGCAARRERHDEELSVRVCRQPEGFIPRDQHSPSITSLSPPPSLSILRHPPL